MAGEINSRRFEPYTAVPAGEHGRDGNRRAMARPKGFEPLTSAFGELWIRVKIFDPCGFLAKGAVERSRNIT
jgi:hypothetical protein